jgi:hypothetical protein
MFLDLILNEVYQYTTMFEVRHMYVYLYNWTGQVRCLSAMRMTLSKPEEGYTILDNYHEALSETNRFTN